MEEIAGYKAQTPRHWNNSTLHCYSRYGRCVGCEYHRFDYPPYFCQIKGSMILSIRLFGKPKDIQLQQILKE